nr:hypothetical protein [Tanacetum cinerariifolium]
YYSERIRVTKLFDERNKVVAWRWFNKVLIRKSWSNLKCITKYLCSYFKLLIIEHEVVIINHILSKHNTLSKRPESWTHTIKDDAVLGMLKFVNKGEDHPKYGMSIPDVMMSDTIRNSAHYAKYLARSTGTQSSVPTRRRRGKGTISRKNVEVKVHTKKTKDRVRRRNRYITIADNVVKDPDHAIELAVSTSLDEAETLEEERRLHERHASLLDDHQKKKLKGVATEPDDVAQSLLNLRKVVTSDKSNWGSDEEQLVTIDDEQVMKLLKDHLAIKRKNDSSKTILQRLVELEKKVDAMSKVDHTDIIEKSVKAHVDAMSKKELPKVVPDFGAKKTTPNNFDKQYDITPTQRKRRTRADHEKDKKKRRQKDTDDFAC